MHGNWNDGSTRQRTPIPFSRQLFALVLSIAFQSLILPLVNTADEMMLSGVGQSALPGVSEHIITANAASRLRTRAADFARPHHPALGIGRGADMERALLEVRNLKARYAAKSCGEVHAVDDVSLKLEVGKVLGIVGESGCGKSTLSMALMGYFIRRCATSPETSSYADKTSPA